MADDAVKHFGIGAVLGGIAAYSIRVLQERAERAGRATGARQFGGERSEY